MGRALTEYAFVNANSWLVCWQRTGSVTPTDHKIIELEVQSLFVCNFCPCLYHISCCKWSWIKRFVPIGENLGVNFFSSPADYSHLSPLLTCVWKSATLIKTCPQMLLPENPQKVLCHLWYLDEARCSSAKLLRAGKVWLNPSEE